MQNGKVFELPTQERHTSVSESLLLPIPEDSLLRTPIAGEVEGGAVAPEVAKAKGQTLRLSGQMIDMVAPNQLPKLMPTPNTMDHLPARTPQQKAANKGKGGYSNVRETVVNELMPTPTTRDYKDGAEPHERDGVIQTDSLARAVFKSGEVLLPTTRTSMANGATKKEVEAGNPKSRIETEVLLMPTPTAVDGNTVAKSELDANDPKHRLKVAAQVLARDGVNWGKFEPAIKRWEQVLGRLAPSPTKPDGKDGNQRLSSVFTEWMMGVPEGWITDCGLKRNEELKACGNGVVPQQAELALRILLEGFTIPTGGGQVNLPTPTVSDTFTDNLKSSQQKPGSMHSVTLPQAVRMVTNEH
jgi:hypothetical protein